MERWAEARTLFDAFQIEGYWWYPHSPDCKVAGLLTYTKDDIILDLYGTPYPHPDHRTMEDLRPKVIYGETFTRMPVTVMNCEERSGGMGSRRAAYGANHLFVGEHLPLDPEPRYPAMWAEYTHLTAWALPKWAKVRTRRTEHQISVVLIRTEPAPLVEAYLPSIAAKLRVVGTYRHWGSYGQGVDEHVEYAVRVEIVPDEPQTLGWFNRAHLNCQNLLTLLVGTYVVPIRFAVEKPQPFDFDAPSPVSIFAYPFSSLRRHHSSEPPSTTVFIRLADIRDDFAGIAQKWFENVELLQPIYDLLFGVLANEMTYISFQFLAFTQALESYLRRERGGAYLSEEAYAPHLQAMIRAIPQDLKQDHRDSLKTRLKYGYQYSLRKRIKQELDALPYELRKYICFGEGKTFVKAIVDTRNYLTHYERDEGSLVLESTLDLQVAVRRLRIFLVALMLKSVGFSDAQIVAAFENDIWVSNTFHEWRAWWLR